MLLEIYIKNFVLIEELRMQFSSGLNVLTGETGAGKSIIIDALGLIMGDRVSGDLVRNPAQKAVAQAVFNLEGNQEASRFMREAGLLDEAEDTLVVTREILPQGRSLARINGSNVSIGTLRQLAASLLDLHLQHDHLTLLKPDRYISLIDSFLDQGSHLSLETREAYKFWAGLELEMQELKEQENNRLQNLDFLNYQIAEIEKAKLQAGEEEEHQALLERIRNAGKLSESSSRLLSLLYEADGHRSAVDLLAAAREIAHNAKYDPFFAALLEPLEEAYYSLQEISRRLSSFRDSLDYEPGLLDFLEERLHQIDRLKARYGNDIPSILAYLDRARLDREGLENNAERIDRLRKDIERSEQAYQDLAGQLSRLRHKAACELQERVRRELKELNLPNTIFRIGLEKRAQPGPDGWDKAEFLFSANPGEEERALARVASGGEISRVVLALKKALASVYKLPTLIFDEIDVGVGGTSLAAMAGKLKDLANQHQVILVTHAPQVAAQADRHFLIKKIQASDHTMVDVEIMDYEERSQEIARMLAGENYSQLTLEHAKEMLGPARP